MADNLTDTAENLALEWLFRTGTAVTRPTDPIKVKLTTTTGTDSAAGTEVTGGSYAAQSVTFGAASAGSIANTTTVTFTNMPAATVLAVELWDSAGSPIRLAYGALTASKTTNAGDTFTIAIGALTMALA